jgi:apolipoprotein N-acyltransferase
LDPSSKTPNPDTKTSLGNFAGLSFQLFIFNLALFWLGNFIDEKLKNQWPIFLVIAILLSVFGSLWYLIKKTSK